MGRRVARVGGPNCDDVWRELATRLEVAPTACPEQVAEGVSAELSDEVIIAHEARPTRWGTAVGDELARLLSQPETHRAARLIVLAASRQCPHGPAISVDNALTNADTERWWSAVLDDRTTELPRFDRLGALEKWWSAARKTPSDAEPSRPTLSAPATGLLVSLSLCQRACSLELVKEMGGDETLDELRAAGLVEADERGRLRVEATTTNEASAEQAQRAADALCRAAAKDPWANMRAAELYAYCGQLEAAEKVACTAIVLAGDPISRADFFRRLENLLSRHEQQGRREQRWPCEGLLKFARLALRYCDVDRALSFARRAAADGANRFDVMLTLGRASTARADIPTATTALHKALELAATASQRAQVAVHLAELYYDVADYDKAKQHAEFALQQAARNAIVLAARNVLGKLLLARGAWTEAEAHFAADGSAATCAGELQAELRAHLNRAIAIMQCGDLRRAHNLLVTVLDDARIAGERRAEAMALANLGTVTTLMHDYAKGLDYWQRAIDAMRDVGDRLRLSSLIMNLAELRLRLGMIDEAEQALRFARQACGGLPDSRVMLASFVTAKIRLAQGHSLQAAAEIESALSAASRSGNGAKVNECYRLMVRIGLEDGDVTRASAALDKARQTATGPDATADIAVLEAILRRTEGRDFEPAAHRALQLASDATDAELRRQAHVLSHHAADLAHDDQGAQRHLDAALKLRDSMASSLAEPIRQRYLTRPDLRELAQLEARRDTSSNPSTAPGRGETSELSPQSQTTQLGPRMVGNSTGMRSLFAAIRKVGPTDATVLIQGESGTGKELVAEALHEASERRSGPLVKVNCAALVETLLLSELFGHEKGAFTGASMRRQGRFEHADGGTLFLDEIGDISPRTQVALLRVLQDQSFERVGGTTTLHTDVRIICATNRDLAAMVAAGEFREDLYYRLAGVTLEVPALRRRRDDLPLLAQSLLQRFGTQQGLEVKGLSAQANHALAQYDWPGNVRELENALRAAALFTEGPTIELQDLTNNVASLNHLEQLASIPAPQPNGNGPPEPEAPADRSATDVVYAEVKSGVGLPEMKRELERACIVLALEEAEGNITRAAEMLGMKRPRLSQLVNQLGLKKEGARS